VFFLNFFILFCLFFFSRWTALHFAADRGHAEVVRLLLYYGADIDARESGTSVCGVKVLVYAALRC
jgi:ankyrin repeat protein